MQIIEAPDGPIKRGSFVKHPCCAGCALDDLEEGRGDDSFYKVSRQVFLTPKEYEAFAQDLNQTQLFLDDKGGYFSTDPRNPFEFTTPQELMEWENGKYRDVVIVKSSGYHTLLIDAQLKGHPVWVGAEDDSVVEN